ncbi:hypothetical protein [Nocardiopsis dassonvillei]|uniref:hypothetical protein n=1 Tax=Nocardiopsis dassonvillei TaxID=2014 RepID=UPI00362C78D8
MPFPSSPRPWCPGLRLYGLAPLLTAHLWRRHGRDRVPAEVTAPEGANGRAAAR